MSASQQLEELLEGNENEEKEYKSADKLEDNDEIARQLVAFANAEGGNLIFGVDDDGNVENKDINEDDEVGKISNIARMSCSPTVRFSHDFYPKENSSIRKGDVLVIEIKNREDIDIPHARTKDEGNEIKYREYRIRAGNETRLIDDDELRWIIERGANSQINYECQNMYTYYVENYRRFPVTETRSSDYFSRVIEAAPENLLEARSSSRHILHAVSYLAPYALYLNLSRYFGPHWQMEAEYKPGGQDQTPGGRNQIDRLSYPSNSEKDEIHIDDLEIHSSMNLDLDMLLQNLQEANARKLSVPKNTDVIIRHRVNGNKLVMNKSDVFKFEFNFFPSSASSGIPANHPERMKHNIDEKKVGVTKMQVSFSADFNFPRREMRTMRCITHMPKR